MTGPAVIPDAYATRDFFERLAGLPLAAEAAGAFGRLFARSPAPHRPGLAAELYRALTGHLLDWLGLARSAGGLNWEWRPLLLLEAETDPFYVNEAQLARRLAECPPLRPEQRETLLRALHGFFALRRGGLLERGTPLVSEALQEQWIVLFPAEFAWRSLEALRAVGLYPVGSAAAFRSLVRFSAGEFAAPLTVPALRAWQEACRTAAGEDAESSPARTAAAPASAVPMAGAQPFAAHRADFLAAAFAGELTALGIAGPCGAVPRCDECPLRTECNWASAIGMAAGGVGAGRTAAARTTAVRTAASGAVASDGNAAAARARLGQLEAVGLEGLLEGLFDLPAAERERLEAKLKGGSLRSLAAKSAVELEEWLDAAGVSGGGLSAERLLLLFEVCRRFGEERMEPGVAFGHGRDVFRHFRLRFRDLKQERFLVVLLDIKKRYLGDVMITQGGLDSSPVHPREVFAAAVRERAAFVLLVHNHPSGDPAPSPDDLVATRELARLGKLMGIPVLDHVILGNERYVSVRESGLVEL